MVGASVGTVTVWLDEDDREAVIGLFSSVLSVLDSEALLVAFKKPDVSNVVGNGVVYVVDRSKVVVTLGPGLVLVSTSLVAGAVEAIGCQLGLLIMEHGINLHSAMSELDGST